jgi:predicted dehydrogenase
VHGIEVRRRAISSRCEDRARAVQRRWGFEKTLPDWRMLLDDASIDVIHICAPPAAHEEMIRAGLQAGKHVICEKPLTGYFGGGEDNSPVGSAPKALMYAQLLSALDDLRAVVESSGRAFMYAENFIYAPAVVRAADIITAKKSRILYMRGEESLRGSSSPVAGEWRETGGGSLIRVGIHPLCAMLWLKQKEAEARGQRIIPVSVLADTIRVTVGLSEYEHRHIDARPKDVEDCATVIVAFSDGSRAVVTAADVLLGGSRNELNLYCNDAAINCKLTLGDMLCTYLLDEDGLDGVEFSEMLPGKLGWNNPFVADAVNRGYAGEMQDFMECAAYGGQPQSGFSTAYDALKIVYAAYVSAEEGRRVDLD